MEKRGREITPGQDAGNEAGNTPGKTPPENSPQVAEILAALGALAEMSHVFYTGMIGAGASPAEAAAGMTAFISAYIQHAKGGQAGDKDADTG